MLTRTSERQTGDVDWDSLGLAFLGLWYSSSTHFFWFRVCDGSCASCVYVSACMISQCVVVTQEVDSDFLMRDGAVNS